MKAFKFIAVITLVILVVSSAAFAAEGADYSNELYKLGIIRGTDKGLEPEKSFTRAEAVTVIVRLLGEEENVLNYDFESAFSDVPQSHWAYRYVMYCHSKGITNGTGADKFSPGKEIDASQFMTLMLRLMGYEDVLVEEALDKAVEYRIYNSQVAKKFKEADSFKREDMFYILHRCLKSDMQDGTPLARELADKGVISDKQADKYDVYEDFENIDELIGELLD